MSRELKVGELVRLLPGVRLTGRAEDAGIKGGSIVRVDFVTEHHPGFWALADRHGYCHGASYERNPKVRVGDRVRIKEGASVSPILIGAVLEVTALDADGDPVFRDSGLCAHEYELVTYDTPISYYPKKKGQKTPTPAPVLRGFGSYRAKLKAVLIEQYATEADNLQEHGWNGALCHVAKAMGMRLTLKPAHVTCEDVT